MSKTAHAEMEGGGGDSTLGGVFTRAYSSVKLSLIIRVVEADYLL